VATAAPARRATSARHCAACDRSWPERAARFCGVCGGPLGTAEATLVGARSRAGSRLPRRYRPITVVAALALVALVALPRLAGFALFEPAVEDLAVAEPTPASADEAQLLSDRDPAQADELRALVDPGRLTCEPSPCELWRLRGRDMQPYAATVEGNRLALVDGSDVVLLEVDSGVVMLRAQLPTATEDAPPADVVQQWGAVPLDDGVAVAIGGIVSVFDDDGSPRWERRLPRAEAGVLQAVGGNLLLETVEPSSPGAMLRLFAASSGDTLFEQAGHSSAHGTSDDDVLVVWDQDEGGPGGAVAVDPSSGDVLWQRPATPAAGPVWPIPLGDLLLFRREPPIWYEHVDPSGGPDATANTDEDPLVASLGSMGPSELVDRRTGRTVRTFDRPVVGGAHSGTRRAVATATPEDAATLWGSGSLDAEATVQLHVLDDDGDDRAAHELVVSVRHGCCFDVYTTGEDLIVEARVERWRVEVDGSLTPATGQAPRDWADPVTGLTHGWRDGGLTLRSTSGASVDIASHEVFVVGAVGDIAVVATQREILAVRLQHDDA
jgi:hypothetical protein